MISLKLLFRSKGQYPVLIITNKGKKFLKLTEKIELPEVKIKVLKSVSKKSDSSELEEEFDRDLFEELRSLRKSIADENDVPPFVVFSDVSLRQMCREFPKTNREFLEIHGVGNTKLERYGESFMGIIRNFAKKV